MLSPRKLANALRFLSIDAVQKANSGHPGMPMGMADIAAVLWQNFLRHNPSNPQWWNRDRFVLSNGHGSMLLYSLLHLSGYDLTLEDLKNFRQLHSKTPGHPEYGFTPGVETTTGPLGQGLANAVGMALAERLLAADFNQDNFEIIKHWTYCFVGDGCLMEGISHEACSLAGTLGLGKLIVFWDDNGISIDGAVQDWWQDDTPKRFEAYGWQVIAAVDGHDATEIQLAIQAAQADLNRPTLIACKTHIGFGSPNLVGKAKTHGSPLGVAEVQATREALGWTEAPFVISKAYYEAWDSRAKGQALEQDWQALWEKYQTVYPHLAQDLMRRKAGALPQGLSQQLEELALAWQQDTQAVASRKASQNVLEKIVPLMPELLGGSADLSESNLTYTHGSKAIKRDHLKGNYLFYGVREFAMSAIMNGLAVYGGFIPYGGTFLTFLDYARNAVRMSALMKQRVIYIYSHDSIGLGEDGPTHQPIEHLSLLRLTPNMSLWRPSDAVETAVAWRQALENTSGPSSLALSRQNLPLAARNAEQVQAIARGAYILLDCVGIPEVILLATGSEVALALEAAKALSNTYRIRVLSMPCCEVFEQQSAQYREQILPKAVKARVAIEAAATAYWYKWVGLDGAVLGLDRFGESAPAAQIYQALGLDVPHIIEAVHTVYKNLGMFRSML